MPHKKKLTPPVPPPRTRADPINEGHMKMATVLVVDDNDMVARTVSKVIRRMGHNPMMVTCWEAIEICGEGKADLVISDLDMPEMDGLELLRRVKEKNPDMEVLIHTGNSSMRDPGLLAAGAKEVLHKPMSAIEMMQAIDRNIKK